MVIVLHLSLYEKHDVLTREIEEICRVPNKKQLAIILLDHLIWSLFERMVAKTHYKITVLNYKDLLLNLFFDASLIKFSILF